MLIEEAHHFAPHGDEAVSTGILKQVLAEGRKFGIGVGLISQRPGKLDADVLSQCLTQCIMRIVNEVDQKSVAAAVEGVGRDLLDNLPALSKGQAIIAGAAVNTPVICRVRPRITPHGGESKDAPAEWRSYLGGAGRRRARARDGASSHRDSHARFSIFKGGARTERSLIRPRPPSPCGEKAQCKLSGRGKHTCPLPLTSAQRPPRPAGRGGRG